MRPFSLKVDQAQATIDPNNYDKSELGRKGSLLRAALSHGLKIKHVCGGAGNCTTCHVYVLAGLDSLSKAQAKERAKLKEVYGGQSNSRLACQALVEGSEDLKIETP